MTISLHWLQDYLDLPHAPERVAEMLTGLGLEVEGQAVWESVPGLLRGVVVGRVLTCGKHPGADRLSLTTVDIGEPEPVQIVCGAPNVAAGQTVLVATVGTTLHPTGADEPLTIKKGKIRGEVSLGMICAEDELGLGRSHDGILVLHEPHPPGTPASDFLPVTSDTVLEIGLTPNRSDATSHRGVAADLRAHLMAHEAYTQPLGRSRAGESATPTATAPPAIAVEVLDPQRAPRYAGVVLTGVTVGPSPDWLRHRLEAIGVRSINNVVDATNYILHDLGQPLHAFDLDRLGASGIRVRTLPQNTPFVTLDGTTRKLDAEDLVICDAADAPLCLAGVFGGQGSGVTASTTRVFLESARFDPTSVRRTAARHHLRTDAARTFEKGVDPSGVVDALRAAVALLGEVAGARAEGEIVDIVAEGLAPAEVTLALPKLRQLTGVDADAAEVRAILESLDFDVLAESADRESLRLAVPTNRADVTRDVDVIEEFLRVYGYDRVPLPSQIRLTPALQAYPSPHQLRRRAAEYLLGRGLHEAMGLSLVPSKVYETLAPALTGELVRIHNTSTVELDALRLNLVPTGLQAITYNQNRQRLDLQFFEFGRGYRRPGGPGAAPTEYEQLAVWTTGSRRPGHWTGGTKAEATGFAHVRGLAEGLVVALGLSIDGEAGVDVGAGRDQETAPDTGLPSTNHFAYAQALRVGDTTVAQVGRVAADYVRYFDCKSDEVYLALADWGALADLAARTAGHTVVREPSRFPQVRRDLALLVGTGVSFGDIVALSRKPATGLCRSVELFDVFEDAGKLGAGKRSYAVRYVFERADRTLQDREVDRAMAAVTAALEGHPDIQVRR